MPRWPDASNPQIWQAAALQLLLMHSENSKSAVSPITSGESTSEAVPLRAMEGYVRAIAAQQLLRADIWHQWLASRVLMSRQSAAKMQAAGAPHTNYTLSHCPVAFNLLLPSSIAYRALASRRGCCNKDQIRSHPGAHCEANLYSTTSKVDVKT